MFIDELTKNLQASWAQLDRSRRTGAVVAVVLVVLISIGAGYWLLRTNYEVLFSDLDERDAAAIVADLKHGKLPYRLADDGRKLLVPEKIVHETRIRLMGKGVLMNGGVGFEIFDNKELGMTEYTQKINYQRALQGELARTIMAMTAVKMARVHLVLPEASIFRREKIKPKASVSLILTPGGKLTNEQILGVQRLVAASVPGIESAGVTVLDQRGITLSALVDGEGDGVATGSKLRMKREVEDYLTKKIAEVMDRTYGPGKAIVSIDVTLNFDEIRRTDQDVVPLSSAGGEAVGVVVRKRQSLYKQGREGVSKAVDNADAYSQGNNLNSTNEIEYEVSKHVQQVVTAPGGIRRVSVGVLLPGAVNSEQVQKVREVVSMVAGLNADRGDAIVVHGVDQLMLQDVQTPADAAMQAAPLEADMPNQSGWTFARDWIMAAVLGAIVLALIGVFGVQRLRRKQTTMGPGQTSRQELLTEIKQWIAVEKDGSLESSKS